MGDPIRVLVVDDSAYVRKVVREILSQNPFIEVVGTARDGQEALELVRTLRPDVVTLDLIMPNMDGIGFLERQMKEAPLPVLILSIASETSELAIKALEMGAVDFVQKPTALATEKLFEVSEDLVQKVKTAAQIPIGRLTGNGAQQVKPISVHLEMPPETAVDLCVIGLSTGGPQALKYLISSLPREFPVPIAIVLHMPPGYTDLYARRLNEISPITFVEAQGGEVLRPGMAVLGKGGFHLYIERDKHQELVTRLDKRPTDALHKPSVDVLFRSAAEVLRSRVLGVVMTGMGSDGREGAAWIKSQGGMVITQSEESCTVYGMPRSVVEAGLSDRSAGLEELPRVILEMAVKGQKGA